jgi:hypothetical protein
MVILYKPLNIVDPFTELPTLLSSKVDSITVDCLPYLSDKTTPT